jgi:hypothetical protein
MNEDGPPHVHFWHLWTDSEGGSHQSRREMNDFSLASIKPPAAPQWLGGKMEGATCFVTVLPVGWIGAWHENPAPQWIIPLSGRWFVESMDGQRVEMGAGELSLGADQGTRPAHGRQGHLSGTVGEEPAVLMIIQLPRAPAIDPPDPP